MHPRRIQSLVEKAGDPAAREALGVGAEQRMAELRVAGVSVMLFGADEYPPWLATIPDSPDLLFVRGSLPTLAGVAVVGSRRATRYGPNLAKTMGGAMGRQGVTVVSGLARGIDEAVHQGVVETGGTRSGGAGLGS